MKDPLDRQTGDLLQAASSSRPRQAAYVARQRAMGRRQRGYWLTDAEAEAVAQLIEQLRQSQPVAANGRTVERR